MLVLYWLYKSKVNKKGLMPIMMRITLEENRVNFPSQISTEEKLWDKDKQLIRGKDDLTSKYNQYLHSLKTKAWETFNDSIKEGTPITPQQIKEYILGTDASSYTLLETFDYHINQLKSRVGHDIAPATIRNYETCKRMVEEFLISEKKVDDIFLHQFIQELDVFMLVKKGLHNNGVVKNMQQFKGVIRAATRNEWLQKNPFSQYQSKIIESKRVHLTKDELTRLEASPLLSERLERIRDVFVFSCYTGLAYADAHKLHSLHMHHIEVYVFKRKWTSS